MVRRDWSLLSKELGDFCLNQILSGGYVTMRASFSNSCIYLLFIIIILNNTYLLKTALIFS